MHHRHTVPVLLLAAAAWPSGARGATDLETIAQVRHDLWGQVRMPGWQLVRLRTESGALVVDGYAGLEWASGLGQGVDPDLYHLNATWSQDTVSVTAGRLPVQGALWMQTLDGASVSWMRGPGVQVEGVVGVARHQDLDDFLDGAFLSRLGAVLTREDLVGRVGFQVESGTATPTAMRQDGEIRYTPHLGDLEPRLGARVVMGESVVYAGPAILEWGRVEGSFKPRAGLRTGVHAQRRAAVDPDSLFGDKILSTYTDGAVNELGMEGSMLGPRWATMSARAAWVTYERVDGRKSGGVVDVSWVSPRGDEELRIAPAWSARTGPNGAFHTLSAVETWRMDARDVVTVRQGLVPFRKGYQPWEVAASVGGELDHTFNPWARARVEADLATDAMELLEWRVAAAVVVSAP